MKRFVAAGVALGVIQFSAVAAAHGLSPGGGYALAMNDAASVSSHIDVPDSGGGSIANAGRGAGDTAGHAKGGSTAMHPLEGMQRGDAGLPAAMTPKRPTYRWQSLVPGAIK